MNIQPKVVPEKRDERENGSASVTAAAGPQQRVWMMRTSDSAPWQPCPSPMTLEERVVPPATTGASKTALRPNTSNFIMAKNLVDTTSFLNVVEQLFRCHLYMAIGAVWGGEVKTLVIWMDHDLDKVRLHPEVEMKTTKSRHMDGKGKKSEYFYYKLKGTAYGLTVAAQQLKLIPNAYWDQLGLTFKEEPLPGLGEEPIQYLEMNAEKVLLRIHRAKLLPLIDGDFWITFNRYQDQKMARIICSINSKETAMGQYPHLFVDKTYEDYLAEDTETDGLTDADEEAGTDEDETDETGEPEAKKRARPATKPGTTKGTGGQN